jgi:hypothetical protein
VLVLTAAPLVPAVPWRLVLHRPLALANARAPRPDLAAGLAVEIARGHAAPAEELAG